MAYQFFPFMMSGFFGGIFMIFWWAIIIIGIMILVRWIRGQDQKEEEQDPMKILKQRYAKGEIGKEEFEKIKKDLEESKN